MIRLQIPELNEERRRDLVKVVHGVAEEGRVAVRNIRRDVMHDLRELKKEGEVGEDDERRAEAELQKRTDGAIARDRGAAEGQRGRDPRGVRPRPGRAARYVAIITDGNGRWAQQRGLPPIEGHRAGADVVKERLRDAAELRRRGADRVLVLDRELVAPAGRGRGPDARCSRERIDRETPELDEEGVRMRFIGRRDGVDAELVERMEWAEELTAANDRITLFVAFNYGGRAEIVDAARKLRRVEPRRSSARHLYAPEMHDPDLLIRTSGEQRISNYLLWQCAYSELVFRDELWPDFTREAFEESLGEFEARQRRFGAALAAARREAPCR